MNISIVVQGPYFNDETDELLLKLHTYFPTAELIFSSWPGVNEKYSYVNYITNVDPGQMPTDIIFLRNIKRLFVSTLSGIKHASNDIILKMRSDSTCNVDTARHVFELINLIDENKIYIAMHSTPTKVFFLDDKVQIGPRKLMIKFWSCDSSIVNQIQQKLINYKDKLNIFLSSQGRLYICSEQALFCNYSGVDLNAANCALRYYFLYLKLLRKNFIFINASAMGFSSIKWPYKNTLKLKIYLLIINSLPISCASLIFWGVRTALKVRFVVSNKVKNSNN